MTKYIRKSTPILAKRTLSEFGEMVNEIAKEKGSHSAPLQWSQTINHGIIFKTEARAYVSDYTVTAESVEECIQKVERMCLGKKDEIHQEIIL